MPGTNEHEVIDLTGLESDESDTNSSGNEEDDEPLKESHNGHAHGVHSATATIGSDNDSDDSSGDEVEIPLNEETRSQVKNAIISLTPERLRQILLELVETEQAVEIALTRELITLHRDTRSIIPRWESCRNCKIDFDVNTQRTESECCFHSGDLEVDEKAFPDWDEMVHGPMDSEENMIQYPEKFIWSCCEESGQRPGCNLGVHEPATSRKRRRI